MEIIIGLYTLSEHWLSDASIMLQKEKACNCICCMWMYSVDMVHIGGTRTDNDTDLKPRPADRERILQHAYRTMPALKVCGSHST